MIRNLFLALGLALAAGAMAASEPTADQAMELLKISGVETQLQSLQPQVREAFASESADLAPADAALIQQAIDRQFSGSALTPQALAVVRQRWNDTHGSAALGWLRSDLGRRITRLEEYASTPEGLAELEGFGAELAAAPPAAGRVVLLSRLNEAFDGTTMAVDATLAIAMAVASGMNAVTPTELQADPATLREQIEAGRAPLAAQMDRYILVYYLFTYGELTDTEVLSYIDFLESPAGIWYVNTLSTAYVQPLIDQALGLGATVRELREPG
jgi:hypothetical protein